MTQLELADACEKATDTNIPRKAFAVLEEYENTGGIIWAKTAVEARRIGADEYADGEFSNVSCRRAPWADPYFGKDLPISEMVAHGWNFECSGCGVRIDSDLLWERDLEYEDIIGHQHSLCFCTAVCEARYNLERAECKRVQTRWLRRFTKIVQRRFPDAKPEHNHAYATRRNGVVRLEQVSVAFDFPGREYGLAQLRWDRNSSWQAERKKPYYTCSNGDKAAFETYAAQTAAVLRAGRQG